MSSNLFITLGAMMLSPIVSIIYIARRMYFGSQPQRMKANRPSYTAEMVCQWRSVATLLGVMNDPFAWELLDWDAQFLAYVSASMSKTFGSSMGTGACMMTARTLMMDEIATQSACKQFVVLGAGYDARPYRLPLTPDCKVFEVDMPATQHAKKRAMADIKKRVPKKMFARDLSQVEFVEVDFATESFMDKLKAKGFNVSEGKTFFTLEGVASYLAKEELMNTLRDVSSHCASGTRLVFNARRRAAMTRDRVFYRILKTIGEPPKFEILDDDDLFVLFGKANTGFVVEKVEEFDDLVKKWVPSGYGQHVIKGTIVTLRVP